MAPPRIPGGRGGGRGRGKGGYKGRMGKNFRKNPDGSDKPKGKARRSGLGMWGVGLIATAIAGLVALVAHREKAALEKESEAVRRRLRRKTTGIQRARGVPHGLQVHRRRRSDGDAEDRKAEREALNAERETVPAVGAGGRAGAGGVGGV
jgi:hypothetical protein